MLIRVNDLDSHGRVVDAGTCSQKPSAPNNFQLKCTASSLLGRQQWRYCTVLYCTVLYCTALHCTALHCTALHCTALHCTVHCTALHCTALHCTALHCTALHCTTVEHPTLMYQSNRPFVVGLERVSRPTTRLQLV
jgi:hypothetical protein